MEKKGKRGKEGRKKGGKGEKGSRNKEVKRKEGENRKEVTQRKEHLQLVGKGGWRLSSLSFNLKSSCSFQRAAYIATCVLNHYLEMGEENL